MILNRLFRAAVGTNDRFSRGVATRNFSQVRHDSCCERAQREIKRSGLGSKQSFELSSNSYSPTRPGRSLSAGFTAVCSVHTLPNWHQVTTLVAVPTPAIVARQCLCTTPDASGILPWIHTPGHADPTVFFFYPSQLIACVHSIRSNPYFIRVTRVVFVEILGINPTTGPFLH